MSDLISRQEVIKAMESNSFMVEVFGTKRKMIDGMAFCCDIAELPTVEAKPVEWIPCSERLPSTEKPYKSVLLQLKKSMVVGYINKAGQWFVDTGDCWCADLDEKPIAWMPLPQSYDADMRGGKNEDNI